ncbi:MAG: hypothetical protein IIC91_12565 [Chloroflexi bacterium]|nr:hypothetical protein [Chloroflexota bacterium]
MSNPPTPKPIVSSVNLKNAPKQVISGLEFKAETSIVEPVRGPLKMMKRTGSVAALPPLDDGSDGRVGGGMTRQLSIHHTIAVDYVRYGRSPSCTVSDDCAQRIEQAMGNESDLAEGEREAWEKNAAWWDEYTGADGNAFHRELVAPS